MNKLGFVFGVVFLSLLVYPFVYEGGIPHNTITTLMLWSGVMDRVPRFESDFESEAEVEKAFALDKIERHSWALSEEVKSHGERSLRIQIRSGDKAVFEEGEAMGVERADFQDPLFIPLFDPSFAPFNSGLEVWYRIDFLIPNEESFPILDERLVFLHFKQIGGNNALFSMRYRSGTLSIKLRHDDIRTTYAGPPVERNRWYRVVVHSCVTKANDGVMEVFLDDAKIVEHAGLTAYPKQPPLTYNKFGLYRDHYADPNRQLPPMTIYYDHYIRGASWEDVVPEGDSIPARVEAALWPSQRKVVREPKDHWLRSDFWKSKPTP